MSVATLTLAGKKFVVIPQREYDTLKARANGKGKARSRKPTKQELGDIAESRRVLATEKTIPFSEVRRKLGV
mgnify:CR=1 FL=1